MYKVVHNAMELSVQTVTVNFAKHDLKTLIATIMILQQSISLKFTTRQYIYIYIVVTVRVLLVAVIVVAVVVIVVAIAA
jgi:hypothetical protein